MIKNELVTLMITAASSDGSGIAHHEGMVVFVPGTFVGDRVTALIIKVKKSYAIGKLTGILEPSVHRVESDCKVADRCGGCAYRQIDYGEECRIKFNSVKDAMMRIGGVEFEPKDILAAENRCGYRNKAQYPVGEGKDGLVFGFYAPHSHRIVPCEDCKLQPDVFASALRCVKEWAVQAGVSIYSEESHSGLLRHVLLRYAEMTGEVMVVPVINGDKLPDTELLTRLLKDALGENLKSLQYNINKKDTNVVLGEKCVPVYGSAFITDVLCGVKVRISPLSFYQVNRKMAERLYEKAAEYADVKGKTVLDLFCGAGTIGLSMARDAERIIGVEIVPEAVEDAKFNAEANNIKNAEFLCGDAEFAARELSSRGMKPDVVIVDPPRKGCSEGLLQIIATNFAPERVVYVSCDAATLARDCKILSGLGYRVVEYTPVDLFPGTVHVECVVLISRERTNVY